MTLNLSMCDDKSTDTKYPKKNPRKKKQSYVMCYVLNVRGCMSPVTCHISLVTIANSNSNRPSPLLTHQLCTLSWLAKTNFNPQKFVQTLQKKLQFCHTTDTLLDQKSPVHREPGFPGGDKQTDFTTFYAKLAQVPIQ